MLAPLKIKLFYLTKPIKLHFFYFKTYVSFVNRIEIINFNWDNQERTTIIIYTELQVQYLHHAYSDYCGKLMFR